jgi:acyl-CoA dehydrogenase family member 9
VPKTPNLADPHKNPSFTKGLFLGEIREDLVFPFPELSPDDSEALTAILDSLQAFADEHVDRAQFDHDGKFPDTMRQAFHELGMMGINTPEAYGGLGANALMFSRIMGAVGEVDAALAVYFGAHQSIGCKGIILFGTDDQKAKYLPGCASGETVAGFCLTEAGSGSDAKAMRTTAVPSADGSHYVLNGQKIWISNAGYASLFTVFAQVPVTVDGVAKQRVTAFIVDAKAPGVSLGAIEQKMGIKASDTRTVSFENVVVPVADRLGEVGQGFNIALEILNSGRLGLAAGSSRGTRAVMREAIAYAKQREQFGRPIASFEMLQKKIALAAVECYASDAAWMLTAGMMDRGGIDFSLETAACKVFASELAFKTASEALQMAGGLGYSKEYPYEQALRDSRINMIFEGTNEILLALIALSGLQQPGEQLKELGRAFKRPLASLGSISSYLAGRAKRQVVKPSFSQVHPALKDEADMVAELVQDLGLAVEKALIAHGKDIIERQFLQERMAKASMDLYLSTAVLSRVTWAIGKAGSPEAAKDDLDAAKLFIPMATRRARRQIVALDHHQDDRLRAVAQRALDTGELTLLTPTDV